MEKFLLFTMKKSGSALVSTPEVAMYNANDLKSMKPSSSSTIDLDFEINNSIETVVLDVVGGNQSNVIRAISSAIVAPTQQIIRVADVENDYFINKYIVGVTLKIGPSAIAKFKITDATTVNVLAIDGKLRNLKSMTLANVHTGNAIVQVYLRNTSGTLYYILKDITIPAGVTLVLEADELDYESSEFGLYVKLGGSTPVDVIIR